MKKKFRPSCNWPSVKGINAGSPSPSSRCPGGCDCAPSSAPQDALQLALAQAPLRVIGRGQERGEGGGGGGGVGRWGVGGGGVGGGGGAPPPPQARHKGVRNMRCARGLQLIAHSAICSHCLL